VFTHVRAVQDLVSCGASHDDPLPDASCLHLSINAAALTELRAMKQKQKQLEASQAGAAAATATAAVLGAGGAATTGGLWGCAAEWAGLSCRHSGSWQLSLLYSPEELARFSTVRARTARRVFCLFNWQMHLGSSWLLIRPSSATCLAPPLQQCRPLHAQPATRAPGPAMDDLLSACRCSDLLRVAAAGCCRRGASWCSCAG
jgi:hypothetical protein